MRIGVEANHMLAPHLTGIEYSLTELVKHLPQVAPQHEYVLHFNFRRREYLQRFEERVRPLLNASLQAHVCRIPAMLLGPHGDRLRWPIDASIGRCAAVYYHACNVRPQWSGARVLTIHDLMPLTHGEYYPPAQVARFKREVPRMARRAEALVAVSEYTRQAMVERLGIDARRIFVVHHGVDARFQPPPAPRIAAVKERLGLRRPYVLFVGTSEPRKNLLRLLEAFGRIRSRGHDDLELVIAGKAAWGTTALRERICQLGLDTEVRLLGHVDCGDLPALYAGADVFCLPSIAEGFGMPLLEAMACGAPVVASNTSALPEVYADAALGVDPTDIEALAVAMARVREDGELRAAMVARGLRRAAECTWQTTARRMVDVFEQVGR